MTATSLNFALLDANRPGVARLIAAHGADYPMPNLLNHLAAPGCSRIGSHWDRCGVHYVEPIEGAR